MSSHLVLTPWGTVVCEEGRVRAETKAGKPVLQRLKTLSPIGQQNCIPPEIRVAVREPSSRSALLLPNYLCAKLLSRKGLGTIARSAYAKCCTLRAPKFQDFARVGGCRSAPKNGMLLEIPPCVGPVFQVVQSHCVAGPSEPPVPCASSLDLLSQAIPLGVSYRAEPDS